MRKVVLHILLCILDGCCFKMGSLRLAYMPRGGGLGEEVLLASQVCVFLTLENICRLVWCVVTYHHHDQEEQTCAKKMEEYCLHKVD